MSVPEKPGIQKHLQLFSSMLAISAVTFGGGFVIVSMMKRKFVDELKWLTENEMLDMIALSQSSPGAIAVNAAILVGRQVAGTTGMIMAVLGTILPPLILLSAISYFYVAFASNEYVAAILRGMQAGVAAVIVDVVINLGGKVVRERDALSIIMMIAAFVCSFVLHINVVYIILGAIVIGVARLLIARGKARA